tara:strand:- start:109 stop:417 length:309 start_codon:yes stop_codon:yes gene_type:complete
MKILDEYVIILNILLFVLIFYNLCKKCKIIEGHNPNSQEIDNAEKAKSSDKSGSALIKEASEKNKDAKKSSENAEKSNNDTNWDYHNEQAKENNEKIKNLSN